MPDTLPTDDEQLDEDQQFAMEYVREHGRLDDLWHVPDAPGGEN